MHTAHYISSVLIAASMLAASAYPMQLCAQGAMPSPANAMDETAIRSALAAYNAALNGGKTDAVLPLYTDDGVFMPPYSQSAVGKGAVRKAYDAVFAELSKKLGVNVGMAEIGRTKWLAEAFDQQKVKYPRTEKGNPSFTAGR